MAQSPDEKTYVEIPFIEQLKGMGWDHIEGDIDVPYLTEREGLKAHQCLVLKAPFPLISRFLIAGALANRRRGPLGR